MQEYIEQEDQVESGFIVNSDERAEWAINKIREIQADSDRQAEVCKKFITRYSESLKKVKTSTAFDIDRLKSKLIDYFQTVPHKTLKKSEQYKLPTGRINMKFPTLEFTRDNNKLVQWLKDNNKADLVKTTESPMWAELKEEESIVITADGVIYKDTGLMVEGVTVTETPEKYEVVIDE